jgi:tetratricopeptide (TPR) repeat protein
MANALSRTGKLKEAQEYIKQALEHLSPTNTIVAPTALHTYAFVLLQSGDYEGAEKMLRRGLAIIEDNWAYVDYSIRTYPLLVESLLGVRWWEAQHHLDKKTLREARRLVRKALFWGKRFPNYLPHALRVSGRVTLVGGRPRKALDHFGRAISAATSIGAQFDLARAYLDRAKVTGGDAEDERQGRQMLAEIGAVVPVDESS